MRTVSTLTQTINALTRLRRRYKSIQDVWCNIDERSEPFRKSFPARADNHRWHFVFRMITHGKVLHVAMITGNDNQAVLVLPCCQQARHHRVEQFQERNTTFEGTAMPDLIGN